MPTLDKRMYRGRGSAQQGNGHGEESSASSDAEDVTSGPTLRSGKRAAPASSSSSPSPWKHRGQNRTKRDKRKKKKNGRN